MNKQKVLDKLESVTNEISEIKGDMEDKIDKLDDIQDDLETQVYQLDSEIDELTDLREEYEDSEEEEKAVNNEFNVGDIIVALPSADAPYSTTKHNNGFGKVTDVVSRTRIEVYWTAPRTTMTVTVDSKHFKVA